MLAGRQRLDHIDPLFPDGDERGGLVAAALLTLVFGDSFQIVHHDGALAIRQYRVGRALLFDDARESGSLEGRRAQLQSHANDLIARITQHALDQRRLAAPHGSVDIGRDRFSLHQP